MTINLFPGCSAEELSEYLIFFISIILGLSLTAFISIMAWNEIKSRTKIDKDLSGE